MEYEVNVRMRENENQIQLRRLSRLQCALVHCTYLNCVWARTALQAYLLLDICTFSHFPFFPFVYVLLESIIIQNLYSALQPQQ